MIIDYNYKIDAKGVTFDGATFYVYTPEKTNKGFIYSINTFGNYQDSGGSDGVAYISELVFTSPEGNDVSIKNISPTTIFLTINDFFAQFSFPQTFNSSSFYRQFQSTRMAINAQHDVCTVPIQLKKAIISTDDTTTSTPTIPVTWLFPVQIFPLY
jgi:hypothetical protein